jgi:hypothetical protein
MRFYCVINIRNHSVKDLNLICGQMRWAAVGCTLYIPGSLALKMKANSNFHSVSIPVSDGKRKDKRSSFCYPKIESVTGSDSQT